MNFKKSTNSPNDDADEFLLNLMRQRGINNSQSTAQTNTQNVFPSNTQNNYQSRFIRTQPTAFIPINTTSEEDEERLYLEKLQASRGSKASNTWFHQTHVKEEEPDPEEFLNKMSRNHINININNRLPEIESDKDNEITADDFLEEMRRKREIIKSDDAPKITTITFDFTNNNQDNPVVTTAYEDSSSDEDEEPKISYIPSTKVEEEEEEPINLEDLVYQIKYKYDDNEVLTTTPALSKKNMINFLSKQGSNGSFNPVIAFNNSLTEDEKLRIKEETIRKNIGIVNQPDNQSENEKIIAELGAKRSSLTKAELKKLSQAEKEEKERKKNEKEIAKFTKRSKKAQEIISKKDSIKEVEVLTDDDRLLDKLSEEILGNRLKSVSDIADWIVKIVNPEKKLKGFEMLFMGLKDPILQKIMYIEIIRRIDIESIESKKFKASMKKYSETFTKDEIIKFQLREMEDIIPPFSPFEEKKMSLDAWQIDVFKYINSRYSVLIDAPTASGKTVCATYCVTVCTLVLFVLPSKELANQVAGVIRNMKTTSSDFTPIKLITSENIYEDSDPKVYIGTAVDLERYFNLENARRIKNRDLYIDNQFDIDAFDYIIVDEIHQMNTPEQGCAMQRLIKRFKCPMLGLSATIGNPENLQKWLKYLKEETPNVEVKRVSYDKRFINQQKHVWNGNQLVPIHPLASITLEDIQDEKLLRTDMQFIPKDLFLLYDNMQKIYPKSSIQTVNPSNFFENACISLNECKKYESVMKSCLTELSQEFPNETYRLLQNFIVPDVVLENLGPKEIYTVLKQMQNENKLPAIIFKFDPTTCRQVAHDLLEWMETEEQLKYPHYRETRELQAKHFKEMQNRLATVDTIDFGKSDDVKSDKIDRENSIKDQCLREFIESYKRLIGHYIHKYKNDLEIREMSEEERRRIEFYISNYSREMKDVEKIRVLREINVFAPHPDFTFSSISISMGTMIEIKNLLKEYTEQIAGNLTKKKLTNNFNIGYNHFFLRSIERGFALYLNALPVPFQRIGQMLIADGGAPVTFSDESLAFGVNYPIRSVGLLGSVNNDIIDKAKADQASGRSGRRGLDTKGHTVYIGVNWKELIASEYINVTGVNPDNEYMTLPLEFNIKFDVKRLQLVSLNDYCEILNEQDSRKALQEKQIERRQEMRNTHMEVVERLGMKNYMNIYRLSDYGNLSEILLDFLLFLSNKLYCGTMIERYDLFEMIGTLTDKYHDEELLFENEQNAEIMYEFQAEMGEKGIMIELHGCNSLTKAYKKSLFDQDTSLAMIRIRHINEIIRILYNQSWQMKHSNRWVGMLLMIFDEIKNQIFKNTI